MNGRRAAAPFVLVTLIVVALAAALGFAVGGGAQALVVRASGVDTSPAKPLQDVAAQPADPLGAQTFRSCSIEDVVAQPGALDFHGHIVDAETGEVLFDRQGTTANPTASTMKLVTSAAALQVLGPDRTLATRVVQGAEPGQVVVVGGGDFTLSSLPAGAPGYYDGATAHLADLAAQVRAAMGGQAVTSIVVDTSLFGGPEWQPSWNDADRTDGYISWMSPFMVDGDRADPTQLNSPRSQEPAQRAATAFASELGAAGVPISIGGTAPEGAAVLGEVASQPVEELVRYALLDSDNVTAETLARLVAIEVGAGNDFAAIQAGTSAAMEQLGLDPAGLVFADGSGLSRDNRVTSTFMVDLLELVRTDANGLGVIQQDLPASGETGTLDDRFVPGTSTVPPGAIDAKTGWIEEVYGLAGFMSTDSGRTLTFALYVVGPVQPPNRDVLDSIAAAAFACGPELADW